MKTFNNKWLRKLPESPHQVLAIINEANAAYEYIKNSKANSKIKAEERYHEKGIYVGTYVTIVTDLEKKPHLAGLWKVVKILGDRVSVKKDGDKMTWHLTGFNFKVTE